MTEKLPFVILEGLDKSRKFRLTLNALIELQEKWSFNLDDPKAFIKKLSDFKALRFILCLGLKADDPEITEDKIGDIFDIVNMEPVLEKILPYLGIKPAKNVTRVPPRKKKRSGAGASPSKQPVELD